MGNKGQEYATYQFLEHGQSVCHGLVERELGMSTRRRSKDSLVTNVATVHAKQEECMRICIGRDHGAGCLKLEDSAIAWA